MSGTREPNDLTLTAHIDGASRGNPGPAAVGVLIESDGRPVLEVGRYIGHTTNNVAEYKALVIGLEESLRLGAKHLCVFSDSQLVVRQVNGVYKVKDHKLLLLFRQAKHLSQQLKSFQLKYVDRVFNSQADRLARRTLIQSLRKGLKQAGWSLFSDFRRDREESPSSAGQGGP